MTKFVKNKRKKQQQSNYMSFLKHNQNSCKKRIWVKLFWPIIKSCEIYWEKKVNIKFMVTWKWNVFSANYNDVLQATTLPMNQNFFVETTSIFHNLADFPYNLQIFYKPELFSSTLRLFSANEIFSTNHNFFLQFAFFLHPTTFLLSAMFYNFVWILWLEFGALVEHFTAKLWWATAKLKLTKVTNLNLKSPFYRVNGLLFHSTVGGECEGRKLGDMKCCRLEG